MRRLLMLMVLMVLVAVGQVSNVGVLKGLYWRGLSHSEKLTFIAGAMVGSEAGLVLARNATTEHHGINIDLIREMDAFYNVEANIPVHVVASLVYIQSKLDGASKKDLDTLLTNARQAAIK